MTTLYVFAALSLFLILWGLIEASAKIRMVHRNIGSRGLKVLWLSDIHCRMWFSPKRLRKLVQRINLQGPDIIIIGGDFIDHGTRFIKPAVQELSELKASFGVYAVLGNHDVRMYKNRSIRQELMQELGKTDIKLLYNADDRVQTEFGPVRIIGTGDVMEDIAYIHHLGPFYPSDPCDPSSETSETSGSNTSETSSENMSDTSSEIRILATHNPDFVTFLEDDDSFTIILSGHTHGGQITFFGIPITTHTDHRKELGKGLRTYRGKQVIISNGVGTNLVPMRIGAPPSVELVHL